MRCINYILILLPVFSVCLIAQEIKLPSNPLDGRIVFEEKGCIYCHSVSGYGGTIGPDLGRNQYYGSFLQLASIIWNHIPEMDRKYREINVPRPNFTQDDMLNLIGFLYYLRYLGEPGSVANGKKLLNSKGCLNCHNISGEGGLVGPDFNNLQKIASPLYIVQAMWNHGPAMQKEIKKLNLEYPTLEGKDIVDISAYIQQATLGNTEIRMSPGNPANGKKIFQNKNCQSCHSVNREDKKLGPSLSEINLNVSVTEIAGVMWNHSPEMIEYMKMQSLKWPQFQGNEMADLIAYLYFLGFEDELGNPIEGENVFIDKGCASCHEEGGKGIGPDLREMKRFGNPIKLTQLMWNHAPKMEDLLLAQNEEWPQLTAQQMRNLYTYLKSITQKK